MPIDTPHPSVVRRLAQWKKIQIAVEGEDCVKSHGDVFLPRQYYKRHTERTNRIFDDYVRRATFPDYVGRTHRLVTKMCFHREPTITIPKAYKSILDNADGRGTKFKHYARQVVREMIAPGRVGCLVDVGVAGGSPYQTWYRAENCTKWWTARNEVTGAEELRRVIVKELRVVTDPEDPDDLIEIPVWRDFRLVVGQGLPQVIGFSGETMLAEPGESERDAYVEVVTWRRKKPRAESPELYPDGTIQFKRRPGDDDEMVVEGRPIVLQRAGQVLDFIPFKFGNPDSVCENPSIPIMLGVTNAALALYRNSADLENGRHWSGHAQAYLFGAKGRKTGGNKGSDLDEIEYGNGTVWVDQNENAKAGIFGVDSAFDSLEHGVEEKKQQIIEQGGQLIESKPTQLTATYTRSREDADKSAIAQVADTAEVLLTQMLVWQVWWANPGTRLEDLKKEIRVKLNPDQGISVTARDAKAWAEVNIINPTALTDQELFELFKRQGVYDDEMTFEEHKKQVALIKAERKLEQEEQMRASGGRVSADTEADMDEEAKGYESRQDTEMGDVSRQERRRRE